MKNAKKKKIVTIVMALVAVISVIGASYAVWRYTFTGSANTIETSKIELELLESTDEIINITNALPISDDEGKSQNKTFNFAVTTRTKAVQDIGYSLKIEKLSVDSGYTNLNDNQIKIYLTDYNNNELLSPTLVSNLSNYVLYGKTNSHNNTVTEIQDKYKLRVWIDKDVLVNDWNENTKLQYKFKIGVVEKQEQASTSNAVYSWSTSNVSLGDSLDSINGYTTDYTTLNKSYFLKHNIGTDNAVESQEMCYVLNGTLYCLRGGLENYEENFNVLSESFGMNQCKEYSDYAVCSATDFAVNLSFNGAFVISDSDSFCDMTVEKVSYCGYGVGGDDIG